MGPIHRCSRFGFLHFWLWAYIVLSLSSDSSADPTDGASLEKVVSNFMQDYQHNLAHGTVGIFSACERNPGEVREVFRPLTAHPAPAVRRLAIHVLSRYDFEGSVDCIVKALEEPIDIAVKAVRRVKWSPELARLRAEARAHLRHWAELGSAHCSNSLSVIGEAEDIPSIRKGLQFVRDGGIEWGDSELRLQARWEQTHEGIPPFERTGLDFQQAMARLGSEGELEFFRLRLEGPDRERAVDALERCLYIARPELADAVARWLPGTELEYCHPEDVINPTPGFLAMQVLELTFAHLVPPGNTKERYEAWKALVQKPGWAATRSAVVLDPEQPGPHSAPPATTGEAKATGGDVDFAQNEARDAQIQADDSRRRSTVVVSVILLAAILWLLTARLRRRKRGS